MHKLTVPISEEAIRELKAGDPVSLNGVIVTGRDAAHKYLIDNFVKTGGQPPAAEQDMYATLQTLLKESVIYHCGPVVQQTDGIWKFVAAGPTTSIREEPYQADVIEHFNVRAVIGKGGMGAKTLQACQDFGAVYLHAIGGAATLIAESVKEVITVHKMEFGVPEAFWVIRVEDFPVVVTMDSHGNSLHKQMLEQSTEKFAQLIKG
ncbi:MAG: fumarate hydratase C-terminal domain-containing protein [Anaerolineae bacterium]|nr:fumarate hydratase C-terminal domain-containing protein [Anaerolineae bacterium]